MITYRVELTCAGCGQVYGAGMRVGSIDELPGAAASLVEAAVKGGGYTRNPDAQLFCADCTIDAEVKP
jgi:hypothetical protein